jgi:excisionase family DNA binding protein
MMAMGEPGTAAGWHLLSIREIADACQLSEKAVRRAIDDGELPAVKLRSRLRITPDDFAAWIDSSRRATPVSAPITRAQPCQPHPAGTFRALLQPDGYHEAQR